MNEIQLSVLKQSDFGFLIDFDGTSRELANKIFQTRHPDDTDSSYPTTIKLAKMFMRWKDGEIPDRKQTMQLQNRGGLIAYERIGKEAIIVSFNDVITLKYGLNETANFIEWMSY